MLDFAQKHLPLRSDWRALLIEPPSYPEQLDCLAALLDDWIDAGRGTRPGSGLTRFGGPKFIFTASAT